MLTLANIADEVKKTSSTRCGLYYTIKHVAGQQIYLSTTELDQASCGGQRRGRMVGGVEGRRGSRKEVDSASDMMEWVKTLELYAHDVTLLPCSWGSVAEHAL